MTEELVASIAEAGPEIVVDRIEEFLKDRSLSSEQVSECYNKWSSSYEKDLEKVELGYNNPKQITDAFDKVLGTEADRSNMQVLDVACGTGLVGERLRKLGFCCVDGLDGSAGMIERARGKGLYRNLYEELIGDKPLSKVEQSYYQAVITTGSFLPNHLQPSCLGPLGLLLKTGGYLCIAMRKSYTETDAELSKMEPEIRRLEAQGFWQLVTMETTQNYYGNEDGLIFIMRRC